MGLLTNILKLGSRGALVTYLQTKLLEFGLKVIIDGYFGPDTESSVKEFQSSNSLTPDGLVGPNTIKVLESKVSGEKDTKALDLEEGLQRAAINLEIEYALVKAVTTVESRGKGFLVDGRPIILYERHQFFKRLRKEGIDPNVYSGFIPNIVNGSVGGYLGLEKEYLRLVQAKAINSSIALESCSWGMFQIMGFHYLTLGFNTVEEMVEYCSESLSNQIDLFVRFIKADLRLLNSLKEKDFATFARIYNGPKHKRYDLKILNAYNTFKKGI